MPTKTAAKPRRNIELAKAIAADGRPLYVVGGVAGVNPRLLTKVIQGVERPSAAVKERLARTLNVPEDELFPDSAA